MMTDTNRPALATTDGSLVALAALLERGACEAVRAQRYVEMPAQRPPWQGTGLHLRRGDSYTLIASGRIHWSARHPHLHGGPGFHLWARIHPGGHIVNLVGDAGSFVADRDGELELGIYLGMWRSAQGELDTPTSAYARLEGGLAALALVWRENALRGLAALDALMPCPAARGELARLRAPTPRPPGWSYLYETGASDIFRACDTDTTPRICLHAEDAQGILRKPVSLVIGPDTRLTWRWRLDEHPSRVAENSTRSHDYVSVALEFDDGRDLSWIWSSSLPPGVTFPCPVPAWSARETHRVLRSGLEACGQWLEEDCAVATELAASLPSPPTRIVAVWLICVATFQHGTARASFEALALHDGARRIDLL